MAIQLTTGFSVGSQDLIDDRLVLSKAEMLALNENVYPVQFFCLCSDDNKIYVYNQANTPNDTTGKFVVYVGTDGTTGASIDDDVISPDTTYSSQKIEGDFQKQNSDVLTTASKEIVGAINELDDEIGVKGIPAIEDGYEKAYRNVLEVPNGIIVTNRIMTCDVGSVQAYKVDNNYNLYYAENKVIAGHTYTLEFNGNSSVTNIECLITKYDEDPYQVICLQKENVANNGKITIPENGASAYFNVPITITDISLVDDAFPYDDIRIVVTDGTLVDSNTEVEETTVNGVATVGEYVKFTAGTPEVASTGIYKYIDDKAGSGSGDSTANAVEYINDTVGSNNVEEALNKLIADYYYVAPKVNSFTASPTGGLFEVGTTITAPITFNWDYNKDITSQTLTDCTLADETVRTATYNTDITTNKTFTLSATDGTNNVSKSISYTFVSASYTGVTDTVPTTDTEITALTKSVRTKANLTQAFTTSGLQTIVYAYPSSFGNLTSIINQNNYEVLTNFALSNVTVNGVVYNVYSLSNVNLDNFKYTFKY